MRPREVPFANGDDSASGASPSAHPIRRPSALRRERVQNQKEQQRANGGVDDRGDNAHAEVDAELRQQPPADKGTYDTDDKVIDDPVSSAMHDLSGQPSCNEADRQYDDETFTRHDNLSITRQRELPSIPAGHPIDRKPPRQTRNLRKASLSRSQQNIGGGQRTWRVRTPKTPGRCNLWQSLFRWSTTAKASKSRTR